MLRTQEMMMDLNLNVFKQLELNFEEEKWKTIPDTNDKYLISDRGRVISLFYKTPRVLKAGVNNRTQYEAVNIKYASIGKHKSTSIHRMVAELFVEGFEDGLIVDHIDGDRRNNCYKNLRWVSYKENSADIKGNNFGSRKGVEENMAKQQLKYDKTPNHRRNGNAVVYKVKHISGLESIEVGINNVQAVVGHWDNTIYKLIRTGGVSSNGWSIEKLGRVSEYYAAERK